MMIGVIHKKCILNYKIAKHSTKFLNLKKEDRIYKKYLNQSFDTTIS